MPSKYGFTTKGERAEIRRLAQHAADLERARIQGEREARDADLTAQFDRLDPHVPDVLRDFSDALRGGGQYSVESDRKTHTWVVDDVEADFRHAPNQRFTIVVSKMLSNTEYQYHWDSRRGECSFEVSGDIQEALLELAEKLHQITDLPVRVQVHRIKHEHEIVRGEGYLSLSCLTPIQRHAAIVDGNLQSKRHVLWRRSFP